MTPHIIIFIFSVFVIALTMFTAYGVITIIHEDFIYHRQNNEDIYFAIILIAIGMFILAVAGNLLFHSIVAMTV